VDIYILCQFNELMEAVLYNPSGSEEKPFLKINIVIIGVSPDHLDYGKNDRSP